MKLGYVVLYVPDVEAAVSFYEKAFGASRRSPHPNNQYAELETGDTAFGFASEELVCGLFKDFRRNRPDEPPAGIGVAFVTDDVPAAYARAIAAGAVSHVAPVTRPSGQVLSYVRDLNGVLVEMCSAVSRK
jgi:catechol 2,3-dioxygenase-like lactoylglutathione lyase family enzyme